jgi:hypothetical protein
VPFSVIDNKGKEEKGEEVKKDPYPKYNNSNNPTDDIFLEYSKDDAMPQHDVESDEINELPEINNNDKSYIKYKVCKSSNRYWTPRAVIKYFAEQAKA